MHFYNLIKELSRDKEIILFVDMDGVIALYDVGKPGDFLHKRPLTTRIQELEEISKLHNVDIRILSICRKDYQIEEKNQWLDKYAPYFKKENRIIISKETVTNCTSPEIKANYLNSVKTDKQIVLVDDDNAVLKHVMNNVEGIIAYQDSEMVD